MVTNCDHLKNLKYSHITPLAFTEHGTIMVASVLNSPKAIDVSVFVVRAFVQLREMIVGHKELAHKIAQLERKLCDHDEQILALVEAIKQLMDPKPPPKNGTETGPGQTGRGISSANCMNQSRERSCQSMRSRAS